MDYTNIIVFCENIHACDCGLEFWNRCSSIFETHLGIWKKSKKVPEHETIIKNNISIDILILN